MTTLYADLSHHDWDRAKGDLNFGQIRAATSGAICLRATYGDPKGVHYPTYHFGEMTRAAKAAGFSLLGAYHNLVRGDAASIARQVDWLRAEMDRYGSNWAMLDVERYDELLQADNHPRWDDVQQFHDRWHKVDSRVLGFYIPDWVWQASLGGHSLTGLRGPLVSSEYGRNPAGLNPSTLYVKQGGDKSPLWHAYGGRTPNILQYGSNCRCPGASSHTDVNAYRGTFAQLMQLLTNEKEMADVATLDKEDLAAIKRVVWMEDEAIPSPEGWPNPKNESTAGGTPVRDTWTKADRIEKLLAAIALKLDGDMIDEQVIIDGVLAGLAAKPTAQIADALEAALTAEQFADLIVELRERGDAPEPDPATPDA